MPSLLPPERVTLDGVTYRRDLEGEPSTKTSCPGCVADFDFALCQRLIGAAGCYIGDEGDTPTIWLKVE